MNQELFHYIFNDADIRQLIFTKKRDTFALVRDIEKELYELGMLSGYRTNPPLSHQALEKREFALLETRKFALLEKHCGKPDTSKEQYFKVVKNCYLFMKAQGIPSVFQKCYEAKPVRSDPRNQSMFHPMCLILFKRNYQKYLKSTEVL